VPKSTNEPGCITAPEPLWGKVIGTADFTATMRNQTCKNTNKTDSQRDLHVHNTKTLHTDILIARLCTHVWG